MKISKFVNRMVVAAAFATAALTGTVQAAPIVVNFTAEIIGVNGDPQPLSIGDVGTGSFSYDKSTATAYASGPYTNIYGYSSGFSFNSGAFSSSVSTPYGYTSAHRPGTGDTVFIGGTEYHTAFPGFTSFNIMYQELAGTFIGTGVDLLPDTPDFFSTLANGIVNINLVNGGLVSGVSARIILQQDPGSDVPEPEIIALIGLGLFGIAAARRRRKTQA